MPADAPAVLVVNYGSSALLRENLVPLAQAAPQCRVVVCDNFSTAQERAAITELAQQHGWNLALSENRGFGAGMNVAAEVAIGAGATSLLLLNPDVRLDAENLAALLEAGRQHPGDIVSPMIFEADGRETSPGRYVRLADGRMANPVSAGRLEPMPGLLPWLTATCLLVPVPLWSRAGGMPEEYFLYWEDVEFSRRVAAAGGGMLIAPESRCVHDQGGTQRSADAPRHPRGRTKTRTYLYYNARNRLLFAGRNLETGTVRRWRRTSPAWALWVVKRNRGRLGSVLRPEGAWTAVGRGIRDGFAATRG